MKGSIHHYAKHRNLYPQLISRAASVSQVNDVSVSQAIYKWHDKSLRVISLDIKDADFKDPW